MKIQIEEKMDIVKEYRNALKSGIRLCCSDSYDEKKLEYIPKEIFEANQGCGSPVLCSDLKSSQIIVDIGCGVGLDVFIASKIVGEKGRVIGIDPNIEAIAFAKEHTATIIKNLGYSKPNIEFKHSTMESLPLEDESVDIVISNCVINLAEDKEKVFREIFRILKPGGHLTFSDIFSNVQNPNYIKNDSQLVLQCMGGAMSIQQGLETMRHVGFVGISKNNYRIYKIVDANYFLSLTLTAYKLDANKQQAPNYFMYRGPLQQVQDDFDNHYVRGQIKYIEDLKTLNLLQVPSYQKYFIEYNKTDLMNNVHHKLLSVKTDPGPCKYEGNFAILVGPFVSALDDENHSLNSTELEICRKTSDVYQSENFEPMMIMYNKAREEVHASMTCCDSDSCC